MKSNIEYLKESLSPQNEWLVAVEDELAKLTRQADALEDDKVGLEEEVAEQASEIEELKLKHSEGTDSEIDCGIGKIYFKMPDNIKLAAFVQKLKEDIEEGRVRI